MVFAYRQWGRLGNQLLSTGLRVYGAVVVHNDELIRRLLSGHVGVKSR